MWVINLRKKNILWVCLVTSLFFNMAIIPVGAPKTKIYVDPKSYTAPDIDHVFTIKVTLTDVNNLTGFEFKLYWNRKLLKVTDATYEAPPAWTSPFWIPDEPLNNEYSSTHGLFWLGCLNLPPTPIAGNFTLATLTFEVMSRGSCTLDLDETKLTDPKIELIPHDTIDGEFTTLAQPGAQSGPFSSVNVAIVIVIAIFFVATLYYVKKKILK